MKEKLNKLADKIKELQKSIDETPRGSDKLKELETKQSLLILDLIKLRINSKTPQYLAMS